MKTLPVLAAAVLLSSAAAKVHKLKLNKVPLSDQFVSYPTHPQSTAQLITAIIPCHAVLVVGIY